jgi:hypothetical protein
MLLPLLRDASIQKIREAQRLSVVATFVGLGVGCDCEKFTFASETPRPASQDGRFWRLVNAD